jgi:hypothetical protein
MTSDGQERNTMSLLKFKVTILWRKAKYSSNHKFEHRQAIWTRKQINHKMPFVRVYELSRWFGCDSSKVMNWKSLWNAHAKQDQCPPQKPSFMTRSISLCFPSQHYLNWHLKSNLFLKLYFIIFSHWILKLCILYKLNYNIYMYPVKIHYFMSIVVWVLTNAYSHILPPQSRYRTAPSPPPKFPTSYLSSALPFLPTPCQSLICFCTYSFPECHANDVK